MLFKLDEYDRAAQHRFRAAMNTLTVVIEPALAAFQLREVEAVPTGYVSIDAERTVVLEPAHLPQTIRFDPARLIAGELTGVHEPLIAAATDLAKARLGYMHDKLGELTDATGQVIRASGPIGWDDVMSAVAGLEIKFDANGEPTFVIWPPRVREEYEALPSRTAAQEQRWQQLMARKREEANARKRDRRLS